MDYSTWKYIIDNGYQPVEYIYKPDNFTNPNFGLGIIAYGNKYGLEVKMQASQEDIDYAMANHQLQICGYLGKQTIDNLPYQNACQIYIRQNDGYYLGRQYNRGWYTKPDGTIVTNSSTHRLITPCDTNIHIVSTYYDSESDTVKTFLDGVLKGNEGSSKVWENDLTAGTEYFVYGFNNSSGYVFKGKIYYIKTFDPDRRMTGYFLPCVRKSDGRAGLYDIVNSVFKVSTYDYIKAGPDIIIKLNIEFPIYNSDGSSFYGLVLRKSVVDSVVMSLGDKITGDVLYKDNTLAVTMREYVEYRQNPYDENEEPIRYSLVNPPTIVREGMVADNGELKGMTKYSFEFYHPMYQLSNFPFTDVATKTGEEKYLSQNKTFSWIGKPQDYIDKLNKNLQGTVWYVRKSDRFPVEKDDELSDVQQFDNVSVAEAIKRGYEIWGTPYIVSQLTSNDPLYAQGKRFVVEYGLPSNEIYESESARQLDTPYVFQMGQGVGLKNNSRTPRNNKIVTRIAGYGSEDNVPYGYPQIVWTGNQDWDYTINNDPNNPLSYPIYKGIVGGQYVKLIKHPFTRTHLMPSIFTETVNKKVNPNAVGYDPTIEIKDYYDAVATQEYPYVNEINPQAPSYESHEFADIKPELDADRNTGIVSAVPLNADLTPADHWDDSMDDDGNYLQSYFQITLPQLSFDLYACAAITQEMQINMRSGACIGCTFPIQVDWDDYKRNFYDEDGNFVPDGEQRDLTKYPKSNLGQISVVVQKDNSTFGTLMPNIYQQPKTDDLFVFIGISLPTSYITNAEVRLDAAMKSYMLENNVYYFDYPLKFDEYFLATHTYILEQIRPNSIIRFDYGGIEQQLFVKQLTVKYGNAPLPQYDITLTDNIEVVLNQIGQVADDVEKLSSLIAILRQSYNRNVWNELAKKLSKTQDDTAQGFIRFMQGLQVGSQFVSGILGEGGVFRKDADGKTYIEADKMYVRMKAYFDSVEIREYQHTSGNRIASQAKGFTASRVEWLDANGDITDNINDVVKFRCYWRAKDDEHETQNQFVVGDQAFMEYSDVVDGNLVQKRFWRVVVGRNVSLTEDGEAWIDLSNKATDIITYIDHQGVSRTKTVQGYENGSDIPQAEDDICQLGNVWDSERQGAIIEYVSGGDAPSYQIFQGIDSFSLNGKNYIGLGYNTATGRAYMNVYGDMFIGAKPDPQTGVSPTYIEYKQDDGTQQHKPSLKIKANVEFTNPDSELDTFVQSHQRDDSYDDSWIQPALDAIQEQIDGELDTWYYEGVPTLNNLPAIQWTTDDDKKKHVGDLYYDKATGFVYRFLYDDENESYYWTQIHDDAISEALRIANQAQDTADNKRRVFICDTDHRTPTPPYDEGDLWVNVKYPWATGATYNNEILKCTNTKTSGQSFAIGDWSVANGYTAALKNFIDNTYSPFVTQIHGQIDKKAETWYQGTNPATAWTTTEIKNEHIGDIWHNTNSTTIAGVESGRDAIWNGTSWEMSDVPQSVYDTIDGKADIFVSKPSTYNVNDLWIIESTISDTDIPTGCQKGDIVISSTKRTNSYNKADWKKKDRYTDDSAFNGYINAILNGTGSSGDAATVAAAQKAIKDALGGATVVDGGLLLTSLIAMRKYKGTGDKSDIANYNTWAGISGVRKDTETGTGWKGYGIAAWYGGAMVDKEVSTTATDYAKSLFRFDGSGYLAGGNITWDKDGIVTIANVYSDVNGQPVPWSGATLQYITNLSTLLPITIQSGVTYLDPQVGFKQLSILGKSVATQEWVGQNYVSVAFFERLFQAYNGTTQVHPNSTSTIDNIKAMFGFWTEKYISALGKNTSGGGGGGDIDMTTVWSAMANNTNEQINLSHLTTALSGYATTSWVSQNYALKSDIPTLATLSWSGYSSGSYNGSEAKTISIPSKVSQLNNDAGYITSYTDTKNTAGTTNKTATKMFLVGATSQAANPQTYSNSNVYIGTDNCLYSNGTKVLTSHQSLSNYVKLDPGTTEQTIKSSIGTISKGVINLWRSSGNHVTFLGFSNGTTETYLGGIGFKSQEDTNLYHRAVGGSSYKIWDENNDGASSGLDADLLDGQHGSYYATANSVTTLQGYFTSGSANTAVQLKTARNIWGQSFDGTGNVSGNMTGVGTISASGNITITKTSGVTGVTVNNTNGGENIYYNVVGKNYSMFFGIGSGNVNRGIYDTTNQKWALYFDDSNTILNYGNVGIGTTSPYYKLDVLSTTTDTWAARILGEQTVDSTTSRASVYLAKSSGTGMWVGVSSTTNDGCIANFQRGMTTTGSGGNPAMQIRADGSVCIGVWTATCSTAIGTTAKTATINGYTLVSGRVVRIAFKNGNSVTAPTLNISSTGAKTIRQADNTALTSTTIAAGDVVDLQYDGTYYKIIGINQNIGEDYSLWVNSTIKATNNISVSKPTSASSTISVENINRKISLHASTNGGVYDHKTSTWLLATNGTDTWLSQGNVGIGTTEPAYKLDVEGTLGVNGVATIQSYIYVDRVPYGALSLGTQINVLSARSKNAGTGNYASSAVISTFGSGETGTTVDNFPVRIGSQSGATWISAGESGKTFSKQNTAICNTENLYLTADGNIAMYTGVANDSTNYSSKLAMFVNTSCNVGIGTSSPSYKLHVVGTILGTVGVFSNGYVSALGQNTSSDIRKKDIKENFALSVDEIAAAPSVKYLWKDDKDKGLQVGSIAQYWQNVLPEAVHEDNDGYLTMQYGVIALLSSISVARKVQDHERRIKELEKECERLRFENEQLRLS